MMKPFASAAGPWLGTWELTLAKSGFSPGPDPRSETRTLIIIGAVLLVLLSAFATIRGVLREQEREAGMAALAKAAAGGQALTEDEKSAKEEWKKLLKRRNPSEEELRKDAAEWQGGFISVIKARGKLVIRWASEPYYSPHNFDIWGMMFIGMGLFKLGVLGARKPLRFYLALMVAGYAIGCVINSYTAWKIVQSNFDPVLQLYSYCLYDIGRLSVALGHMSLLLIICQQGAWQWLTSRLGAVGQMALTNYIMTSVICAFIFTGYGLGLYGQLERHQLYYFVAGISLVQLIVSPIWLKYYRFGPLEWCWRALTYGERPPMRLRARHAPPTMIALPQPP